MSPPAQVTQAFLPTLHSDLCMFAGNCRRQIRRRRLAAVGSFCDQVEFRHSFFFFRDEAQHRVDRMARITLGHIRTLSR